MFISAAAIQFIMFMFILKVVLEFLPKWVKGVGFGGIDPYIQVVEIIDANIDNFLQIWTWGKTTQSC